MPRPRIRPTAEQQKLVKALAAYGFTHEQIGQRIGIRSAKTIRRHFREELDRGILEANAMVAKTLHKMAVSGQHPAATFFWLKCRAGWRERPASDVVTSTPPPFIVAQAPEPPKGTSHD